jgi:hypothetical protein
MKEREAAEGYIINFIIAVLYKAQPALRSITYLAPRRRVWIYCILKSSNYKEL